MSSLENIRNTLKGRDFTSIRRFFLDSRAFCEPLCVRGSLRRGCGPANGTGCQFHAYFVLYTNLSFKEMSQIERGAYNRQHNVRSHTLVHTSHGVGIISPCSGMWMHTYRPRAHVCCVCSALDAGLAAHAWFGCSGDRELFLRSIHM